jgi:hypothetical protein
MKRLLLSLALLFTLGAAQARIDTTQVNIKNYGLCNMVVYTPDSIKAGLKIPAVVFIPGIGEQNTILSGLYKNGPLVFIAKGWRPNFIVAGIQPRAHWPGTGFTQGMLDTLVARYPIDTNKVYLTGLSAGASTVFGYVRSMLRYPKWVKPAAIVTFSYTISGSGIDTTTNTRYLCKTDTAFRNLPAWGLCGDKDTYGFYPPMNAFWILMRTNRWTWKNWTTMSGYGHYGWNKWYDPAHLEGVYSIYTWMLRFHR